MNAHTPITAPSWIESERLRATRLFHAVSRYVQALEREQTPEAPESAELAYAAAHFFSSVSGAEPAMLEWGADAIREVEALGDAALTRTMREDAVERSLYRQAVL